MSNQAIGVFDSGVGGISVLRHLVQLLPEERFIYVADQGHVPYGGKSKEEIRSLVERVVLFFIEQEVKLIVLACNTASAAALSYLRERYPAVPFVGMEPAIKPGVAQSKVGKVGILATVGTLQSERYHRLRERFATEVHVWEDPCIGLVDLIESGREESDETEQLLRQILDQMIKGGVDTVVLGCTHYPFVEERVRTIVGAGVTIIDPAPAVAKQVARILEQEQLLSEDDIGSVCFYTTGALVRLERWLDRKWDGAFLVDRLDLG